MKFCKLTSDLEMAVSPRHQSNGQEPFLLADLGRKWDINDTGGALRSCKVWAHHVSHQLEVEPSRVSTFGAAARDQQFRLHSYVGELQIHN